MSLSDLILEANSRGWLLNNLFQRHDTSWQCNLRTATHHTAFGQGSTADLALSRAMDAIESATESSISDATVSFQHLPAPNSQPASDILAGILANLRPATPAVFRRKL